MQHTSWLPKVVAKLFRNVTTDVIIIKTQKNLKGSILLVTLHKVPHTNLATMLLIPRADASKAPVKDNILITI